MIRAERLTDQYLKKNNEAEKKPPKTLGKGFDEILKREIKQYVSNKDCESRGRKASY